MCTPTTGHQKLHDNNPGGPNLHAQSEVKLIFDQLKLGLMMVLPAIKDTQINQDYFDTYMSHSVLPNQSLKLGLLAM